jgi:hypothetical protein
MARGVAFTDQAKADLRAIDQQTALQILRTVARFAQSEEGNSSVSKAPIRRCIVSAPRITASFSAISALPSKSPASAIVAKLIVEQGRRHSSGPPSRAPRLIV